MSGYWRLEVVYRASVVSVMIASPSDVVEQREEVRRIISNWNFVNGYTRKLLLVPVGWETHAAPELGSRAQSLINDRLLEDCDLLVGVFWTKLGTPTGDIQSGTVEEISRHLNAGKPAMVYFSDAPVAPQSIDPDQYAKVQQFKKWCFQQGIVATFTNALEFSKIFDAQLQIQLNTNPYLKGVLDNVVGKDSKVSQTAELSEDGKELLLGVADDPQGQLILTSGYGGHGIQVNGMTFGDPGNARSEARWEAAFEELRSLLFIRPRGTKGQLFQITDAGYKRADMIRGERDG